MTPKTFIFIGRSGCGKGTQAKLLDEYIKKNDSDLHSIFHLETGAKFREFINGDTFTQKKSKDYYDKDLLQPAFLSIHLWSHILIEQIKGDEHLFIDGTPRTIAEYEALKSALKFYERQDPIVIYINVGKDWSRDRLMGRGRMDDDMESVERRLSWYEDTVVPVVEKLKNNTDYKFLEINGEQTVEAVHAEIVSKI